MTAHTLTAEQTAIVTASQTGKDMVIEAAAGSGKTSTLKEIAKANPDRRFLYMAYNKTTQVEAAASFPENVECRTAHSLAFGPAALKNRINAGRISAFDGAKILGIRPYRYILDGEEREMQPYQIYLLVEKAIGRFCNSADEAPVLKHVWVDGIKDEGLRNVIAKYLAAAWSDLTDKNGRLRYFHDIYLKVWALSNPSLRYDGILFDEAQDANPAIAGVVESQTCQKIMVGDSAQAIYGWRGAIDAMINFRCDFRLRLTKSFRFGQTIADVANRWLTILGTDLRVVGHEPIQSTVETLGSEVDAILCRTNAGVIEQAMNALDAGKKVAIAGGTKEIESFAKAAQNLIDGRKTLHAELGCFASWADVNAAVENGEADDLRTLVRIVNNYGTQAILNVCNNSARPEDADLTVSTAHKAKGLEWNRVRIGGDFQQPKDGILSKAECMLIYVAVTRAKLALDWNTLAWIEDLIQA